MLTQSTRCVVSDLRPTSNRLRLGDNPQNDRTMVQSRSKLLFCLTDYLFYRIESLLQSPQTTLQVCLHNHDVARLAVSHAR